MTRLIALAAVAAALGPLTANAAPCAVTPLRPAEIRRLAALYDDWDPDLVVRLAEVESTNCPSAVNGRYKGLVQVDEAYAALMGVDPVVLLDPQANIAAAHFVYLRWGSAFGAWAF